MQHRSRCVAPKPSPLQTASESYRQTLSTDPDSQIEKTANMAGNSSTNQTRVEQAESDAEASFDMPLITTPDEAEALDTDPKAVQALPESEAETQKANALKRKQSDVIDEDDEEDAGAKAKKKRKRLRDKRGAPRTSNKLKGKGAFLQGRFQDRMKGVKPKVEISPRNIVNTARSKHALAEDKRYVDALNKLPAEKPTPEQMAKLNEVMASGPNYLGRTASLASGYRFGIWKRCTNGYTTNTILMPAADTLENQCMHARIDDMPQGRLIYMLAQHLMWHDIPSDEFLSYSEDPLFLIVHALNRYNQNQGKVTIQFLDRRKAKTINDEPAVFYRALDLYDTFEVPVWMACTTPNQISLRPRKFSQEYLTHGTIKVEDSRFIQADIEDLIKDGLYDIFPAFEVPAGNKRVGLYSGQVHFRTIGYPPTDAEKLRKPNGRIYSCAYCAKSTAFTVDFLGKVRKVTLNFMNRANGMKPLEPHLHIFLSFLSFQKRPKKDPVLLKWIKEHYQAEDVVDLYADENGGVQTGFTQVAENLPGVMQYLDLVDDANIAFGLAALPARIVITKNSLTDEIYADEDAKPHMKVEASEAYDEEAMNKKRDKAAESRRLREEKRKEKKAIAGTEVNGQKSSNSESNTVGLLDRQSDTEIEKGEEQVEQSEGSDDE